MSIFGDETITVPGSPEESGQDEGAAGTAGNDESFEDEQDYGDDADLGDEGEQDDEQFDDDEQDSPPAAGQGDGLILGKFKSQNDLANAYLNLERQFTKTRQGGQQQPSDQSQVVPQHGGQQVQQPDLNQKFWERFREDPAGTFMAAVDYAVSQRLSPIEQKERFSSLTTNIQEVAKEYPKINSDEGIQQLREKVREIAEEVGKPELIDNPTARILRMAAREAFGDTAAKAFQKGKEAGRSQAEQTRASKAGASIHAGGKGSRQTGNEVKTPEQEMKEAILAAGRGGGLFS